MLRRQTPGSSVAVHTEAALAGDPDQSGVRAGRRRGRQLVLAEGSAADGAVDARALVFAAGVETFAVLVYPTVVLAGASLRLS